MISKSITLLAFFVISFNLAYAETVIENVETYVENQTNIQTQNVGTSTDTSIVDVLVQEGVATMSGIIGIGIAAIVAWMKKKGIPVTTEQEAMFKQIVTKRFESLAKQTWQDLRANPDKFGSYWENHLSKGKIPPEFVERLRTEGKSFAVGLKENKEFRDFAKKLSEKAMDKLLVDLRTQLKSDYQKRMIDVLPILASRAVDAAFDEHVRDVEGWSQNALEKLKPLLLSSEAIDTQDNLMILVRSEINKRIQNRIPS